MRPDIVELLECPHCHNSLRWMINASTSDVIESGQAVCEQCGAIYPIREGIGIFLLRDQQRSDYWEQSNNYVSSYLKQHPAVEEALLGEPLSTLNPADQFLRARLLEEHGDYLAARAIGEAAMADLYTPETTACLRTQVCSLTENIDMGSQFVIDIASGRGSLAEPLLNCCPNPLIFSDFSPRVLRNNRRRWQAYGIGDRISQLAFDACYTPFRDQSIQTLTTFLGLSNIAAIGKLLQELRRICQGSFLAGLQFYPQDDYANRRIISNYQMEDILFEEAAFHQFRRAGWQIEILSRCSGFARPTPQSTLIEDAGIDALPAFETHLSWVTIRAT